MRASWNHPQHLFRHELRRKPRDIRPRDCGADEPASGFEVYEAGLEEGRGLADVLYYFEEGYDIVTF